MSSHDSLGVIVIEGDDIMSMIHTSQALERDYQAHKRRKRVDVEEDPRSEVEDNGVDEGVEEGNVHMVEEGGVEGNREELHMAEELNDDKDGEGGEEGKVGEGEEGGQAAVDEAADKDVGQVEPRSVDEGDAGSMDEEDTDEISSDDEEMLNKLMDREEKWAKVPSVSHKKAFKCFDCCVSDKPFIGMSPFLHSSESFALRNLSGRRKRRWISERDWVSMESTPSLACRRDWSKPRYTTP